MNVPMTRIYGFGSNGSGQLGVGHREDLTGPQMCCFRFARSESQGVHLDLGSDSDMATTTATATITDTATTLPDGDEVKKLVAGGNHTVVLTDRGRVFVCGENSDGRCGRVTDVQDSNPLVFCHMAGMGGRIVTDVAATWETTFVVTDAQIVWSCGSGRKGELGAGEEVLQTAVPVKIFDADEVGCGAGGYRIVGISGSMNHVVVLLSDGTAYGWGSSRKGQLGLSLQTQKAVWTPLRINLPSSFSAISVVTGRDFTMLVGSDGSHVLLGDLKAAEPLTVKEFRREVQYFVGWSTVYSFHQGRVQGWGQGRRGQLPPADLPSAATIAAGSEHCIALLENGMVVAWGWGEHGNCGLPLDDRSIVANRVNIISTPTGPGEVVAGVGAGCASSFIWTVSRGGND